MELNDLEDRVKVLNVGVGAEEGKARFTSDLDAMNRIYGRRFHEPLPARTSFGVAFLWKGAKVQIDCIAAID